MKKILIPVTILLVLIFVIAGCSSSTVTSTVTTSQTGTTVTVTASSTSTTTTTTKLTPKKGGTLRYIYGYSPGNNIGWPMETNTQNIWGTNYVFAEPLVAYMLDNTAKPWLAESWEFASDYSSITFKLKKGVKFHDGTDFNADAVKWQLEKNIELANRNASNWKSCDVLDPYTVRLNFIAYQNSFFADITATNCFFISPTAFKQNGESIDWMREHPIGTGPFKFVSWERDVNMIFERNNDYWDQPKPYIDRLEFITIKDKMSEQTAMAAGEGDILALQSGRELYDLDNMGFDIVAYAAGTDFLCPDTANPDSVLLDKNIRMAMDYSIDKTAVTRALGYGYMLPNWQLPAPQQTYWNPNLKDRGYNPTKAKELLGLAGFPDGFKTRLYVEGANYGTKALAMQAQLATGGITAEIVTLENLKFWEYLFNGWEDGIMFAGFSWTPNFARSYKSYFPPDGAFFVSIAPPDVSAIVEEAITTTDPNVQREKNYELINVLYDDVTVVPYLSDAMGWAVAPYVMDHHLCLEGADFCSWFPADIWLNK